VNDSDHEYARSRRPRFGDINAMALKVAISGSILAAPDACLVMIIALRSGSTSSNTVYLEQTPAPSIRRPTSR
jgi:hypothetical protein